MTGKYTFNLMYQNIYYSSNKLTPVQTGKLQDFQEINNQFIFSTKQCHNDPEIRVSMSDYYNDKLF
jgi:hypothetical protein